MKDHEREFIEEEIKLPFEQVAALITTIRILAEDDDEDAKDRRIRLTYLLDDVAQTVKERFDKFIDSLYNGGENEQEKRSKEICDFRKNRTVIELMRRYGSNSRLRDINKGGEATRDAYQHFSGKVVEDLDLLRGLFGFKCVMFYSASGVVSAEKDGITYNLDIDDENQDILGIEQDTTYDIGGNENENHT